MSAPRSHRARATLAGLLALALLPALASRSRAAGAPADTTVEGYVRSMADSTDAWFGVSAQPSDTTGIDSLRAWALSHPGAQPRRRGGRIALSPLLAFNRTIGGGLGAEAVMGAARTVGRLVGSATWTTGADTWFGGGEYVKRWARPDEDETGTVLTLRAARDWAGLDRDDHEPALSSLYAFVWGSDRSHYLRRDGASLDLVRRGSAGWIGASVRDQRESPLATTATWYLTGHTPVVTRNDSATAGRVHEAGVRAGLRLGRLPFTLEGRAWSAGGALGGDLAYTRTRLSLGGAVSLGRHVAFAPEAEYGRLTGSAPPQAAFTLGGGTLRSVVAEQVRGSGRALLHADFILLDPLQEILGLERNPAFPIQLGAFAGLGSLWGTDPVSGRAVITSQAFPHRNDWLAEAGGSILYRPGLPNPDSFVRLDWAVPIGPDSRTSRLYLSYARSLNFLRPH